MEDEVIKHPAQVLVGFNRRHRGGPGAGMTLYGTRVRHGTTIALHIKRAETHRNCSHDWFFGREQLIEVVMSPPQFAELISSMNCGDGIPATLVQHLGEDVPKLPETVIEEDKVRNEIKNAAEEVAPKFQELRSAIESAKLSQTGRKELLDKLFEVERRVSDWIPFYVTSMTEKVGKMVSDAKISVDAFVTHMLVKLGLKALKNNEVVSLGWDDERKEIK